MASLPRRVPRNQPFRGVTILIIEDHDDSRTVFKMILEFCGARTLVAQNGVEALEVLKVEQPDLILSDIRMPEMDGYMLMRQLRRSPKLARLPVLAVTALDDEGDTFMTSTAGFNAHLAKPVDADTLVEAVQRTLMRSHPRRPARTPQRRPRGSR